MTGPNPENLFPKDYFEGRANFRAAAADKRYRLTAYTNPYATGPKGEPLTTDVAVLGPAEARQTLVVVSGTHGVEGYAGSGIQHGFLTQAAFATTPSDTRIVLIHALNAHGFAWNRRVTEDNVDLNRNFVDHTIARAPHAGYVELRDAIGPKDLAPDTLSAADAKLAVYAKTHGAFGLQEAISQGQYAFADGMYYGGAREQWSAGLLRHILRRELAKSGRVAVVDVHTGLGPYGYGELITELPADSPQFIRARHWWGDSVTSTKTGDSTSADVFGSIEKAFEECLPHAEVTMACLEYGTYPTLEVFKALRADNWLHLHGDFAAPEAKEIKAQIRRAFYPDCADWKEMVWSRAQAVLGQALEGVRGH
jgi:predicted deacylase